MRGRVMLNGDFEMAELSEGTVVRIFNTMKEVRILSRDGESIQWEGPVDEIPKLWQPTLDSAIRLYRKCMALEGQGETVDTAVCVPGVGWCNVRGKRIQMLFEDGVKLDVDLESQEVVYCDVRRRKERCRLGQEDLPRYVLERLRQCEVFKDVE